MVVGTLQNVEGCKLKFALGLGLTTIVFTTVSLQTPSLLISFML